MKGNEEKEEKESEENIIQNHVRKKEGKQIDS